jgi:uncharacterized membrane protein YeaQ/YmgE (transglycosylase-associated protein family)
MDFGPYTPYVTLAVIGLVAGWLSGLLLGGGGLLRNLIVGVMGAYVGGFLVQMFDLRIGVGSYLVQMFNLNIGLRGWLDQIAVATMGAVVVTIIARIIAR